MIVVLVSTALRDPFLSRFAACQATWDWLRAQGYTVLRLVGDPTLADVVQDDDLLRVPVQEEWQNMGIKLWWAFRHLLAREDVQGVVKLDDDVAVQDPDLAKEDLAQLQRFAYASFAVGVAHALTPITYAMSRVSTGPWKELPFRVSKTTPYGSGSFLYVSRETMHHLATPSALVSLAQCPIEDMAIGLLLSERRVPLTITTTSAFVWGHLDKTLGCSADCVQTAHS
jgi:hypothetical protein